jgi:membrane-anchored protein YejM (alkaline phosphatase superfamily)
MSKTKKNSNDDEYFHNIQANESRFVSHLKECDDVIGNIMSTLDELQLLDKTIVIVTADHGTSFGEKKG